MATKVWRDDKDGELYHDGCFEPNETRDGYSPVKLDELAEDDACASCNGVFLAGLEPEDDEPNGEEEEETA